MEYGSVYDTPVGRVYIAESGGALERLDFIRQDEISGLLQNESSLTRAAAAQLNEYLSGSRRFFELPIRPQGTEFQLRVWAELMKIPYGETRGYGEIAAAIGSPKACRAVGMANNRNRIVIVIPCHRVIGADGSLTGYGGGLDIKRRLLELERQYR